MFNTFICNFFLLISIQNCALILRKFKMAAERVRKELYFLQYFVTLYPKYFSQITSYRIQNEHKAMIEKFYSHTYNRKSIILKKFKKQDGRHDITIFSKLDLLVTWLQIDDKFENKTSLINTFICNCFRLICIQNCALILKKFKMADKKCEKKNFFFSIL